MTDFIDLLSDLTAWAIPLLLAITLHEAAHGYVARHFGDPTAQDAGRVTLNPLKHVDRVGTLLLPALLMLFHSPVMFGYAKPVPVVFQNLTPRRRGEFAVAAAGPATNLALAFVAALLLHLGYVVSPEQAPWLFLCIYRMIIVNCAVAAFNLIPILPLDGGRMLAAVLPQPLRFWWSRTEKLGLIVALAVLLVLPMAFGINLLMPVLSTAMEALVQVVLEITGNGEAQ